MLINMSTHLFNYISFHEVANKKSITCCYCCYCGCYSPLFLLHPSFSFSPPPPPPPLPPPSVSLPE